MQEEKPKRRTRPMPRSWRTRRLAFSATAPGGGSLDDLVVLLDGEDVTDRADVEAARLTYAPGVLPEGERTVVIDVDPEGDDGEGSSAPPDRRYPLHRWRAYRHVIF